MRLPIITNVPSYPPSADAWSRVMLAKSEPRRHKQIRIDDWFKYCEVQLACAMRGMSDNGLLLKEPALPRRC